MTYTNAKTLKPGVYLYASSESLGYFKCNACGFTSGIMTLAFSERSGKKHKCEDIKGK